MQEPYSNWSSNLVVCANLLSHECISTSTHLILSKELIARNLVSKLIAVVHFNCNILIITGLKSSIKTTITIARNKTKDPNNKEWLIKMGHTKWSSGRDTMQAQMTRVKWDRGWVVRLMTTSTIAWALDLWNQIYTYSIRWRSWLTWNETFCDQR